MLKRKPTVAIALAILAILSVARAQASQDPMAVVKALVEPALQILVDRQSPLQERQEKLRALADSNFDFTSMSRLALAYHWREINDSQRSDFTRVFTTFIEDAYLSKIQDYSGQQVRFLSQSYPDPGYAQVTTQIVQPGRQPIPVNYRLLQRDGKWLIYDVTVDNISIIANYRNQFNRVINDQGFAALLSDLKNRQQGLAARLGTPHGSQ